MKKCKNVLYIIIGILLIPVVILLSPVLLIIYFREKKIEKQRSMHSQQMWAEKMKENCKKQFSIPYVEPESPLSDDAFVERIGEFICLQFWSCNDYTGAIAMRELVVSEHPEMKERILAFLQEHPIIEFMHGERHQNAHDVNRWKFRFIFQYPQLNRTISGYGCTELTAPYLHGMCMHLPQILSDEEKAEADFRRRVFEAQFRSTDRKYSDESQSTGNQ